MRSLIPFRRAPEPPPAPAGGRRQADTTAPQETALYVAPQWKLVWWKFRRHRLAMVSAVITAVMVLVGLFAELVAPTTPGDVNAAYVNAPPQRLHVLDTSGGGFDLGLYVHGYTQDLDDETLAVTYTPDPAQRIPVGFFVRGAEYRLLGLIPGDRHLIGPISPDDPMYLLGADRNGRDMLSRIVYGTRISLSVGLVGLVVTFLLGIALGGVSGYVGGAADTAIQRVIEFLMSIPSIPLWLGLAAAVPLTWGPVQKYFAITTILSVIGWTDLARVVRGRFLSLREEDFVRAATLDGCSRPRVIFKHMLPSFASHIIASLTLAIPAMILAETTLSFLGVGLQPPVVSWGVLLLEAQNIRSVATTPWVLIPGIFVAVTVLALNFVGDGIRDSADPYR